MYRPGFEIRDALHSVKTVKPKDDRQREILANMFYAACSWIGGLENTLSDYPEDDEEYINAQEILSKHAELVDEVESMCMTGYYGCGVEGPQQAYQKHYNLAGKEFIHQCAEATVTAMGH